MTEIGYLADHPEHTDLISEWVYTEWADKSKKTLEDVVESFKSRCVKNKIPLTLIALANGKCVGTVTIYKNDLETRKDLGPWLGSLYVSPTHRKQGIGEKLTKRVLEVVKDFGFSKLYLRTEEKADYYSQRGWDFIFKAQDERGIATKVFVYQF